MLIKWNEVKILLRPGATDFRKQINGLSEIAQIELKQNIFSKILFIFCNKNRTRIKILYWDKNGLCLWMKRLEKDKFPWPKNEHEVVEIDFKRFRALLNGIDFFQEHKEIKNTKIF